MSTTAPTTTDLSLRERFERDGCAVLANWLSAGEVEALRDDCAACLAAAGQGSAVSRGCIYETCAADCTSTRFRELRSEAACALIFGQRLGGLLSEVSENSQPCLHLLNEQWIVKPPHCSGSAFAWHRDQEGLGSNTPAYLSVWCALDDVCEENGTLYILPGSHREEVEMPADPGGLAVTADAGCVVLLHSRLLHSSAANISGTTRRAWMPQFSTGALAGVKLAIPLQYG